MDIGLYRLDRVDSTNRYAADHYDELADGTLVYAVEQTAGRGRCGREWLAPRGMNICATLVMKRVTVPHLAAAVVGLSGLALARTAVPGIPAYLKWPNDVYVCDRKLAGILCETCRIEDGRISGIAAGIGINVNLSADDLAAVPLPATSLAVEAGRSFELEKMVVEFAFFLKQYYIIYSRCVADLCLEWKRENRLIGQPLRLIREDGETVSGIFADIADNGSMLLDTPAGVQAFRSGDVRVDRESLIGKTGHWQY